VLTFGTNIWCQGLEPMFRTKVWCQFLVPIFGANFWCEFWSQPVVQILDRWATLYAHQPEPRLTTESRNVLRAISFRKVRVSEEMSSAIQKSPIGASFSEGSCSSWHFRMSDIIGSRGPIILSVKLAHCKNSHWLGVCTYWRHLRARNGMNRLFGSFAKIDITKPSQIAPCGNSLPLISLYRSYYYCRD